MLCVSGYRVTGRSNTPDGARRDYQNRGSYGGQEISAPERIVHGVIGVAGKVTRASGALC